MPHPAAGTDASVAAHDLEAVTEAVLNASRALIGVAARSIAESSDDVTLPQYRALFVLSSRGPQTVGSLAESLSVHPSTATRLCDRLVAKKLVLRRSTPENRREVSVSLAARGRRLVDEVTARRREDIKAIVRRMPSESHLPTVDALRAFAAAAGELPDEVELAGLVSPA
ncbi:MAG: MarR family transcriptional regulator [Acidimicrobiales bacterium]